jgi:GNAT superfamily N-acetyltransferase
MSVERVLLEDDHAWLEWYEPVRAVQLEAWPEDPPQSEEELRAMYANNEYVDRVLLVARADKGDVVGAAIVGMPKKDNLRIADIDVSIDPAHRGLGHGRALLEASESLVADRGRTELISNTFGRVTSDSSREARFARAAGYHRARREVRRDVRLPLNADRLGALLAANASAAADYEIVEWSKSCPEDLLEGRARLAETISDDEPRGDLATERQVWDGRRIRVWEDAVARMGRELMSAGAIERRSRELVAVTDVGLATTGQDLAFQLATVVAPEHRGHRLGILIKIANLQQIAGHECPPRRICTWNGETNEQMIRVNEELGFTIEGEAVNWQKNLG